MSHDYFVKQALNLAYHAAQSGEVPVGAVVVQAGVIVGEGWNQSIQLSDPTAHAEIIALRAAAKKLNNYRLKDCVMYVTLEPCVMCVGAMLHARLSKIVFGAHDPKTGAICSAFQLLEKKHNHSILYEGGVLEQDCGDVLRDFFRAKRIS